MIFSPSPQTVLYYSQLQINAQTQVYIFFTHRNLSFSFNIIVVLAQGDLLFCPSEYIFNFFLLAHSYLLVKTDCM